MSLESPRAVLPLLRAGTAAARRNLGARLDISAAGPTRAAYENFLTALWGFYAPIEVRLASLRGWEEAGFRWTERAKAPWLRRDLLVLGFDAARIDALPLCRDIPQPANLLEAFGCVFMLEETSLAGAQILIGLRRAPIPVGARNFFAGYDGDGAGKWREFCRMLDRLELDERALQSLIGRATETSDCLTTWLEMREISRASPAED